MYRPTGRPWEPLIAQNQPEDLGRPLNPAVNELAGVNVGAMHDLAAVLHVRDFRRLFIALALSSLGDWLGLLATTALAAALATTSSGQLFAIGGVLIVRLLPSVFLGPLAGAVADRFDRRWTMIVSDLARFALFASIPFVGRLDYLYVASFLVEVFGLFWIPAKEASVPNLLPRELLETANQLSLIVTYGSGAVAAGIFALLAVLTRALASGLGFFHSNPVDLSLYFNAVTFLVAAITVAGLSKISGASPGRLRTATEEVEALGFFRMIVEGWRFVGQTPLVRGLVVGILGAFAAGGAVIALGRPYVALLGGGNAAYGLLFGGVFVGLALGMGVGPRLLAEVSRRRLFGMCVVGAGASLAVLAVVPNLALALLLVVVVTTFAGVGWVTGYTLLGLEVANELRGRTFAFVQSLVRTDLLLVLALAPTLAGVIGQHHVTLSNHARIRADGVTIVLFVGGLVAAAVGVFAFREMDDRRGVSVVAELRAGLRIGRLAPVRPGFFIAFEGGEGAGKSSQLRLLAARLTAAGYADVVSTHEPGATASGERLRVLLLDPATQLSPRAEALLYAADRAQHVLEVLCPALDRGALVLCDRYVDSSLAYQGAGRGLGVEEVARLQRAATGGLRPDLTVLLDLPPAAGLARAQARSGADRIEAEQLAFHERVRAAFVELAHRHRARYLVLDASEPAAQLAEQVAAEVLTRLRRRGLSPTPSRQAVPA
ncbi:MAG TPA: dTMP kinase [Mycobacteriales bacterium]|nr:dTMP kinase [Mycobacteriales bacterium]